MTQSVETISETKIKNAVEETARALKLIHPSGNVFEIRMLEATPEGSSRSWPKTYAGYFDNPQKAAEAVHSFGTAKGMYFTPNPVNPALLSRAANRIKVAGKGETTQDSDVTERRWLLIDLDADRPSGISASDEEHEAALDRSQDIHEFLSEQGWADPLAVDSGNGAHLLYCVDLPTEDNELVKRVLESLAARFDDDMVHVDTSVFNPARIWKLPGTVAAKGDSTEDRPHRVARLLSTPESLDVVSMDQLEALAGESTDRGQESQRTAGNNAFDLEGYIKHHSFDVSDREDWNGRQGQGSQWTFATSPMCAHHDGAAHIEQHASGAVTAGCHHNSCSWSWADLKAKYPTPVSTEPTSNKANTQLCRRRHVEVFQKFPVEAIPEPICTFIKHASKAIQCDLSFVALPILAVLASSIGNSRSLKIVNGWEAASILWTAIVGESGTAKSPAFRIALKPIKAIQKKNLDSHAEELKEHDSRLAFFDRKLADWKRNKTTTDEPPRKPEQPEADRQVVSDTTVEALAPLLLHNSRGLLLARDELGGWLGSFDRYSSGKSGADASHWLSMYNGESITVDRKTGSPKTIYVPRASVCITGGIQPTILHRALGTEHRESGLSARFLLACPPRRSKRWSEDEISPQLEDQYAAIVAKLCSLEPFVDEDENEWPVAVELSSQAKEIWKCYFNSHAEEMASLEGEQAAIWSKLEETAVRLALIIHCTRSAAGDSTLINPMVLDEQSMGNGVVLVQWFKHEAQRVRSIISESDADRDQRRLLEWVEQKGGSVSTRDLQRGLRMFRTTDQAEAALIDLVKAETGVWESISSATGGRPSRVFRATYPVDSRHNLVNQGENGGSVDSGTEKWGEV